MCWRPFAGAEAGGSDCLTFGADGMAVDGMKHPFTLLAGETKIGHKADIKSRRRADSFG